MTTTCGISDGTEGTPDNNVYQVGTVGSGSLHGVPVGYSQFNPPVGLGAGCLCGRHGQSRVVRHSAAECSTAAPMQPQADHSMSQPAPYQGYQQYQSVPQVPQYQGHPQGYPTGRNAAGSANASELPATGSHDGAGKSERTCFGKTKKSIFRLPGFEGFTAGQAGWLHSACQMTASYSPTFRTSSDLSSL